MWVSGWPGWASPATPQRHDWHSGGGGWPSTVESAYLIHQPDPRGQDLTHHTPIFFGATLLALEKDGGVRPIAVGCILRRLVAKCAGNRIMQAMAELLRPKQLGYGIPRGAEAAVHAARIYLHNLQPQHLILKLDFRNAFNCLHRDKMLAAVREMVPELYPLIHSAYSHPSSLFFGESVLKFSHLKAYNRETPWAPYCSASPFMTC